MKYKNFHFVLIIGTNQSLYIYELQLRYEQKKVRKILIINEPVFIHNPTKATQARTFRIERICFVVIVKLFITANIKIYLLKNNKYSINIKNLFAIKFY